MGDKSNQTAKADREIEALSAELLDYLKQHPNAGETLEGIVQWWLIRQRYINAASKVRASLLLLEERGFIERFLNPDGVELFMAVPGALRGDLDQRHAHDPDY